MCLNGQSSPLLTIPEPTVPCLRAVTFLPSPATELSQRHRRSKACSPVLMKKASFSRSSHPEGTGVAHSFFTTDLECRLASGAAPSLSYLMWLAHREALQVGEWTKKTTANRSFPTFLSLRPDSIIALLIPLLCLSPQRQCPPFVVEAGD